MVRIHVLDDAFSSRRFLGFRSRHVVCGLQLSLYSHVDGIEVVFA